MELAERRAEELRIDCKRIVADIEPEKRPQIWSRWMAGQELTVEQMLQISDYLKIPRRDLIPIVLGVASPAVSPDSPLPSVDAKPAASPAQYALEPHLLEEISNAERVLSSALGSSGTSLPRQQYDALKCGATLLRRLIALQEKADRKGLDVEMLEEKQVVPQGGR